MLSRASISQKTSPGEPGNQWKRRTDLPTHADIIAESLVKHGVKFAFGLPGGEIAAFYGRLPQDRHPRSVDGP